VIYPKVDSRPAGFSKIWLQDVLRGQLGFEGLVFSDDLSMAGARVLEGRALSYTEAALAALTAGCDMVLLCNQSLAQADGTSPIDELIEGLTQAQAQGRWHMDARSEARRFALLPRFAAAPWNELASSATYLKALDSLP
jgi:beta-N-acetylhexosaminidase